MLHPDTVPEGGAGAPGPRYRPADCCELVARLSAAQAGKKPRRCFTLIPFPKAALARLVRATGPQIAVNS
ncbi:hypothetical protein [Klebsiella oxytoca]|uniref:hypothetical protein n=1 Tax=Klebsiella oxytoca TaxID=571 RepID=UPI000F820994|nr:hypothetical protein [Klebsiella oxytoca]MBZ7261462.1 hypothetical protein [Klebsiella oxytoca]MBZ7695489.1 hypothetical protein [Klebsiella oxytoca]MBZ7706188.1 hypothetical protein [Klebsiella oxytoca]MCE5366505.1 hypothetical protein [Klebsiella oxytoca]QRS17759.1 hypothetical protein I6K64_10390 [Klebsiella oxytoca]